ncbi:DUF2196 domain-containing protein [Paraflavitalea soli]|uniref:DUF2196 domain-containing protein n=1 Tax=Paraflavitalea soli TaxID=2315862 RepID=A0A3B7MV45_9BACT|nr:DUF2196 domain-containing protein [Paraflavitalea soli]
MMVEKFNVFQAIVKELFTTAAYHSRGVKMRLEDGRVGAILGLGLDMFTCFNSMAPRCCRCSSALLPRIPRTQRGGSGEAKRTQCEESGEKRADSGEAKRRKWSKCVIRPRTFVVRPCFYRTPSQNSWYFRGKKAVRPRFFLGPSQHSGKTVPFLNNASGSRCRFAVSTNA